MRVPAGTRVVTTVMGTVRRAAVNESSNRIVVEMCETRHKIFASIDADIEAGKSVYVVDNLYLDQPVHRNFDPVDPEELLAREAAARADAVAAYEAATRVKIEAIRGMSEMSLLTFLMRDNDGLNVMDDEWGNPTIRAAVETRYRELLGESA